MRVAEKVTRNIGILRRELTGRSGYSSPEVPPFIMRATDRIEITVKTPDESFMVETLSEALKKAGWRKVADRRNPDSSYTMYWLL